MDLAKIRKKAKGTPAVSGAKGKALEVPAPEGERPSDRTSAAPPPPPPPPPATPPPEPAPRLDSSESAPAAPPRPDRPPSTPAPPADPPVAPEAPAADGETAPAFTRVEKLLVFAVGRRRYAIPIHDISQIIEEQPVTPVPHSPAFLLGIFSLRGRIVSVLDAGLRLGVPTDSEEAVGKVVVLDVDDELFGVRVQGIDTVAEVDLGTLEPPPESFRTLDHEFVEGVFHHRDRTVSFLNLPLFLAFDSGGQTA